MQAGCKFASDFSALLDFYQLTSGKGDRGARESTIRVTTLLARCAIPMVMMIEIMIGPHNVQKM